MKTKQYISSLLVLMVVLFLVNTFWPEAALAKVQVTCPACVQCYTPVSSWNAPATAGAGTSSTICTTYVPTTTQCPTVTTTETPWDALGAILRAPFVLGQCILGGACP
jgi:hypothetical protein